MTKAKLAGDRVPGLFVRTYSSGAKSYLVVARDQNGKQIWHTLGSTQLMSKDEARDAARDIVKAIRAGKDRSGPETFDKVLEDFMTHYVAAKGLITEKYIRRCLTKHALPMWSGREFTGINRGNVSALLDAVVKNAGPVAADKVLAVVSKLMNWYATRHDDYTSPIVRGMRRSNPKDRERKRVLSDDDLRLVWKQAEANGTFGAFIRLALLTGQREGKLATMKWEDVQDRVWTIPAKAREKGNAGELVLPKEVLAILNELPHYASSPYVFASGRSHVKDFPRMKAQFDAKVPIAHWTIHDLRRTARSLMSAANVQPLIAELTLGHVQKGITAVYDRHQYRDEKADALRRLAQRIVEITTPAPDNVTKLRKRI